MIPPMYRSRTNEAPLNNCHNRHIPSQCLTSHGIFRIRREEEIAIAGICGLKFPLGGHHRDGKPGSVLVYGLTGRNDAAPDLPSLQPAKDDDVARVADS